MSLFAQSVADVKAEFAKNPPALEGAVTTHLFSNGAMDMSRDDLNRFVAWQNRHGIRINISREVYPYTPFGQSAEPIPRGELPEGGGVYRGAVTDAELAAMDRWAGEVGQDEYQRLIAEIRRLKRLITHQSYPIVGLAEETPELRAALEDDRKKAPADVRVSCDPSGVWRKDGRVIHDPEALPGSWQSCRARYVPPEADTPAVVTEKPR